MDKTWHVTEKEIQVLGLNNCKDGDTFSEPGKANGTVGLEARSGVQF